MTKKQIETLILTVQVCKTGEDVITKCKEISAFLKQAWDLYLFHDYEKLQKINRQIWQAGSARIAEIRGLTPNA